MLGWKTNFQSETKSTDNLPLVEVHLTSDNLPIWRQNLYDLKSHQDSVHAGIKYKCNECVYQLTEMGSLKRHQNSVHGGIKYKCNDGITRILKKFILKLIKTLSMEASSTNALNVITK